MGCHQGNTTRVYAECFGKVIAVERTRGNIDRAKEQCNDVDNVEEFEWEVVKKTALLERIPGSSISCSLGHIFAGGYSAGYYSYKWAEVLEADAFEKFKEDGIFNKQTARSFRENILSQGNMKHPMELYKAFRGREPRVEALLKRDGLMVENEA